MNEETLFHEAMARVNSQERAAFLDESCTGKPELRRRWKPSWRRTKRRVRSCKRRRIRPRRSNPTRGGPRPERQACTRTTLGASVSPASITADYQSDAKPNVLVAGRYTLQERIGEGGMGEVWVAKQTEPVKRRVALKLIKTGMESLAVLARFEQERRRWR